TVETDDGMKIRKLVELRTSTAEEYEKVMLDRVEEFKDIKGDKSGFNNTIQNALVKAFSTILDLKLEVEKALGEENVKKVHKALDDILLTGL
ncbi:MAG: hypothetical protein ACFFFB_05470, partial [Candidatus Heimdallarchaeota archaeon]